ncbi:hypothetical protein N9D23_02090 [Rubripirellula sp.]|nr:hypothetical protein [Rubripirellula sp.]
MKIAAPLSGDWSGWLLECLVGSRKLQREDQPSRRRQGVLERDSSCRSLLADDGLFCGKKSESLFAIKVTEC